MKRVPYINLKAQHAALRPELLAAFSGVLKRADFILGDEVARFEQKLAAYCGVKYAVGVNSGTDALFLSLKAFGIGPGDEVITAPNSFLATASSIIAAGARPVFADIRDDLNIDPEQVAAKITRRTKAIIPVHLTGKPAEMSPLRSLAQKHGLVVIEDAAQAIGAEYRGKKVGALGDAGCFSLHPLKTLNACGDGGAVTTNDAKIRDKLVQLRNIGLKNRDESDRWGFNSRLDTVQAALVNVKFKHLEEWTRERRANAAIYAKGLKDVVQVPADVNGERQVYHTFVIQTEQRDELKAYLLAKGVETKVHYPIPIHLQTAARGLGYKKGAFPVCERAAKRILSLPVYQGLRRPQLEYVITTIRKFYGQSA